MKQVIMGEVTGGPTGSPLREGWGRVWVRFVP